MERRLSAILAADVSGYSRLVCLDETDTFRRLKALRAEVLEPLVAGHDGHIVDYSGDGVLADFPNIVRAVECALAIQRAASERDPEACMPKAGAGGTVTGRREGSKTASAATRVQTDRKTTRLPRSYKCAPPMQSSAGQKK